MSRSLWGCSPSCIHVGVAQPISETSYKLAKYEPRVGMNLESGCVRRITTSIASWARKNLIAGNGKRGGKTGGRMEAVGESFLSFFLPFYLSTWCITMSVRFIAKFVA